MTATPTLEDWLWVEVMLVQSLIGAISANVRRIQLCYINSKWQMEALFAENSEEDAEEMEDAVDMMAIYFEDIRNRISDVAYSEINLKIQVHQKPMIFSNDANVRTIFQRKEE